jgi:hypothetical protein
MLVRLHFRRVLRRWIPIVFVLVWVDWLAAGSARRNQSRAGQRARGRDRAGYAHRRVAGWRVGGEDRRRSGSPSLQEELEIIG